MLIVLDITWGYLLPIVLIVEVCLWISNGEPKILKDWTGQIFMIQVIDAIPIDCSFVHMPTYNMNFVEVGNALDENDLYFNNFIDVNYNLGGI